MAIQIDPDTQLGRAATADALTVHGFKTTASTLATKASRGGGPPFRKYGRYPIYRWGDALEWAQSRLSQLVSSTSELDAPEAQKRTGVETEERAGVEAATGVEHLATLPRLGPAPAEQRPVG